MSDLRRKIVRGPHVNIDLPHLPSEGEIVEAIRAAPKRDPRARSGVTANILAQHLKVSGARRLGRGAMKGSWSGTMSPSVRLSPRLASMCRRGIIGRYYKDYRWVYYAKEEAHES